MGCVEAGMVLLEKDDQYGRLGLGACQLDSRGGGERFSRCPSV